MFYFYRDLIRLRHRYELIVYGDYRLLWPEHRQVFAYIRALDMQRLLVVCNLSGEAAEIRVPEEYAGGELLISSCGDVTIRPVMALRPWEAFAILQEKYD